MKLVVDMDVLGPFIKFFVLVYLNVVIRDLVILAQNECSLTAQNYNIPVSDVCMDTIASGSRIILQTYDAFNSRATSCRCSLVTKSDTSVTMTGFSSLGVGFQPCGSYVLFNTSSFTQQVACSSFSGPPFPIKPGNTMDITYFFEDLGTSDGRYCIDLNTEPNVLINITCEPPIQPTTTPATTESTTTTTESTTTTTAKTTTTTAKTTTIITTEASKATTTTAEATTTKSVSPTAMKTTTEATTTSKAPSPTAMTTTIETTTTATTTTESSSPAALTTEVITTKTETPKTATSTETETTSTTRTLTTTTTMMESTNSSISNSTGETTSNTSALSSTTPTNSIEKSTMGISQTTSVAVELSTGLPTISMNTTDNSTNLKTETSSHATEVKTSTASSTEISQTSQSIGKSSTETSLSISSSAQSFTTSTEDVTDVTDSATVPKDDHSTSSSNNQLEIIIPVVVGFFILILLIVIGMHCYNRYKDEKGEYPVARNSDIPKIGKYKTRRSVLKSHEDFEIRNGYLVEKEPNFHENLAFQFESVDNDSASHKLAEDGDQFRTLDETRTNSAGADNEYLYSTVSK